MADPEGGRTAARSRGPRPEKPGAPSKSPAEVAAHVGKLAAGVAESNGLEIFDVQLRREANGWILRVVIDRPDVGESNAVRAGVPGESVGIYECERVSRDLSALLDVEDVWDRAYTLEVSSPGLDRPLRKPDDYRRFAGRLAKLVVAPPIDGQGHFAGRLLGLDGTDVVLEVDGGRTRRIPVSAISRARLEVEF